MADRATQAATSSWWRNWRFPASGAAVVALALTGTIAYGVDLWRDQRAEVAASAAEAQSLIADCVAAVERRDDALSAAALAVGTDDDWMLVTGYVARQSTWHPDMWVALDAAGLDGAADAAAAAGAVESYGVSLEDPCALLGTPQDEGDYEETLAANLTISTAAVVAIAQVDGESAEYASWGTDIASIARLERDRIFAEAVQAYESALAELDDAAAEAADLLDERGDEVADEATTAALDEALDSREASVDLAEDVTAADVDELTAAVVTSRKAIEAAMAEVEDSHEAWEEARAAAAAAAAAAQNSRGPGYYIEDPAVSLGEVVPLDPCAIVGACPPETPALEIPNLSCAYLTNEGGGRPFYCED